MPVLLDVNTVAGLLTVSPKTVYGWIRAKKMAAVKLPGGGLRVKIDVVAEILEMKPEDLAEQIHTEVGKWN